MQPAMGYRRPVFYGNVDKASRRLKQYKAGDDGSWQKNKLLVI
jgi:hypothetical protein